jgi:lipoprotein-anchoring transpeptidase ErfK/SrfK
MAANCAGHFEKVSTLDMRRTAGDAKNLPSLLSGLLIGALAVVVGSDRAQAQSRELAIGEQPGVVPNQRDEQLPAAYQRQVVFYRTNEPAGTIIVDTVYRYLYLVQENGRALRYGIGVGREGFEWQGLLRVSRKAEWPDWTPSPDVLQRQPSLPRFMKGGPGNPLGARMLYLGATYRIHGTNQPQTIGSAVIAGCFRLANDDVIDLYARVSVGTKVVVRQRPTL